MDLQFQLQFRSDTMPEEEKKYWTVVFQYQADNGDPTEIPPHFSDRVVDCLRLLYAEGFGTSCDYGLAVKDIGHEVESRLQ